MRSLESGGRRSHVAPEHWKRGRRAWSRAVCEAHTSVPELGAKTKRHRHTTEMDGV